MAILARGAGPLKHLPGSCESCPAGLPAKRAWFCAIVRFRFCREQNLLLKDNGRHSSLEQHTTPGSIEQPTMMPSSPSLSTLQTQLSYDEAHQLASRLRKALKQHTKDRKWRFKTYHQCFKATHAINHTMENETSGDEKLAVQQLNELIAYGFLCHVVDPLKTIRFPETRVLYFRIVDEIVDNHHPDKRSSLQLRDGFSLINGKFGSSIRADGSANILALQVRLDGVNHVLQETVAELNSANGRLEMLHQEVLSLASNQASMMGFIILLSLYIIFSSVVVQTTDDTMWGSFRLVATSLLIIGATTHGMKFLTMWSDADKTTKRMLPVDSIETETFATTDDFTDDILQPESRSFMISGKRSASIASILSRSMSSFMKRAPLKKLSSGAVFAREAYSLPNVEEWPHRPLLVCVNNPACKTEVPKYGLGACPLGIPFQFESDLFKGECVIRLKGSNSDDPEGDEEYFQGRKRIFQSVIQGCFKEKVKVADVLTGHEFTRPLKNLPHPWVLKTATNFIGKVSPGAKIEAHTDQPFVEAILGGSSQVILVFSCCNLSRIFIAHTYCCNLSRICRSQVIRGDMPGQEPNIKSRNLEEDCSVLGGVFDGEVTASKRKRLLSNSKTNQPYSFDTDTVYTFEFYQNLFDGQLHALSLPYASSKFCAVSHRLLCHVSLHFKATTYSLDLGFAKIGCSHILNGQPIQWLGKLRDGRYLWSFQIWNEKLLKAASQAR